MPESLRLRILEQGTAVFEGPLAEPLELGRQRQDELAHDLYALLPSASGPARLLVARQSEGNVSRQHVLLEPLLSGAVRVSNRSQIPLPTGDELMAMWGVPEPQPDQAARAARASLAMLDTLAPLNQRWRDELGKDMAIGVGINSGPAQVGNTGSRFKFKYGPLGNTVNLASRVQGLTKYLRCRFLVTRPTREQLGDGFIARRVVRARVLNIEEPVDLYEVEQATTPERDAFFRATEAALDALEARDFAAAARAAGGLLLQHRGDGPLLLALSRARAALMNDGADFDPVWAPPGK